MGLEFEQLVRELNPSLFRLALSYTGSREDAEDAVQEVFLKYLRSGRRFDSPEEARRYLMTAVANQCRDLLKSAARRREGRDRSSRTDRPKEASAPVQKSDTERKSDGKKRDRAAQGKAPKLPPSAPPVVAELTEKPAGQQKKHQNRSARRHYDRTGTPHAAPVPEAAPAPVQEHAPKAEGQKKNNRRRYYHHRKPKAE